MIKKIIVSGLAIALTVITLGYPAFARSGHTVFLPHIANGFRGGYGEHYGFKRNFERGRGFGFYSYPSYPYFGSPCYDAALNPYRCLYANPYQYGF